MRLRHSVLASVACLTLGASAASAALIGYSASLSGVQEVPANASPGTGFAAIIHDNVAHTLSVAVSYSGLTSGLSASHIHGAAGPGTNAGVVFGLNFLPVVGLTAGSFSSFWNPIDAANEANLAGGLLYVNIHTSSFPGGEIRGQIRPDQAVPSRASSWGKIKSLYR